MDRSAIEFSNICRSVCVKLQFARSFGVTDKNEGSVQLINVKDKTLVWAAGAGNRSLFLDGWSRGGQSKVEDRIVNKMNKDLFSHLLTNADHPQRNDLSAKGNTNPPSRCAPARSCSSIPASTDCWRKRRDNLQTHQLRAKRSHQHYLDALLLNV